MQESDGWALTQEVGSSKKLVCQGDLGAVKRGGYRNDQTLQIFLCLKFRSKINLFGLEFLENHGVPYWPYLIELECAI